MQPASLWKNRAVAIGNGAALNVSLKLENGVVCTIELATTLPENEERISKHEVITARGIACDMNVDTQTMQSSVYVYGEDKARYTDVDYELFGLDIVGVCIDDALYAIYQLTGENVSDEVVSEVFSKFCVGK